MMQQISAVVTRLTKDCLAAQKPHYIKRQTFDHVCRCLKSLIKRNIQPCAAGFIRAFIADGYVKPQGEPGQRIEHIADASAKAGKEILPIKASIGKNSACAHKSG